MSEGVVVVTGVTGHVGRHVAEILAERGHRVRGISRNPESVPGQDNLELQGADLRDRRKAAEAIHDATAVYLTLPEEGPNPLELESAIAQNVLSAAAEADVEHLVAHTALFADRGDTDVPMIDKKSEVEQRITEAGMPYSILRPGLFLETLLDTQAHPDPGRLRLPFPPSHRFATVTAYDVARAAADLIDTGPVNRGFDIHRPDGLSGNDLARLESETFDRPVHYEPFDGPIESYVADMPMGPQERSQFAALFDFVRSHDYLGDAEAIRQALPEFEYMPTERFFREVSNPRRQDFKGFKQETATR